MHGRDFGSVPAPVGSDLVPSQLQMGFKIRFLFVKCGGMVGSFGAKTVGKKSIWGWMCRLKVGEEMQIMGYLD